MQQKWLRNIQSASVLFLLKLDMIGTYLYVIQIFILQLAPRMRLFMESTLIFFLIKKGSLLDSEVGYRPNIETIQIDKNIKFMWGHPGFVEIP